MITHSKCNTCGQKAPLGYIQCKECAFADVGLCKEPAPVWSFAIQGPKNPVVVARDYLDAMDCGIPVDGESFARVAGIVGDVEAPGLVVKDLDDLSELCKLGRFSIVIADGAFSACHETDAR